ncbi:MAG: DUF1003 domain-containing protein [Pyrinomonadaceae bacterium]|nr:DUF1003 domain-containing protein [Pyrinomonadaceae bacterium]
MCNTEYSSDIRRRAGIFFQKEWNDLTELEKRVLASIVEKRRLSKNPVKIHEDERTFGERMADRVAALGGSWTFITGFAVVLLFWVLLNSFILAKSGAEFDPYPYILLNLFLSMLASIQAPIIMMSQNRQAAHDRLDAQHDYEVNLKAELEIANLHEKFDDLRERVMEDLLSMQKEQMEILGEIRTQTRKT